VKLKAAVNSAEAFASGVELFNARRYWHAHEAWESIWLTAPRPVAPFLQGLIQLAAAYHHLQRGTVRGGTRLFDAGLRRLASYPAGYLGFDRTALVAAADRHRLFAQAAAARMMPGGRASAERLAEEQFPRIELAAGWREQLTADLRQAR
jgi:predicted metal-dependent hydrolase